MAILENTFYILFFLNKNINPISQANLSSAPTHPVSFPLHPSPFSSSTKRLKRNNLTYKYLVGYAKNVFDMTKSHQTSPYKLNLICFVRLSTCPNLEYLIHMRNNLYRENQTKQSKQASKQKQADKQERIDRCEGYQEEQYVEDIDLPFWSCAGMPYRWIDLRNISK